MFLRTHSLFLLCAFWPLVSCGPQSQLHENITDQDLFWGADQYEFSVVLPASGLECFWHFAHMGEIFYLNFMVQWVTGVGHDRHLSVTVNAPGGLLLNTIDDATGQIRFEAKETDLACNLIRWRHLLVSTEIDTFYTILWNILGKASPVRSAGFYQMCFSNFHNSFGVMQVFLSFGVHYDGYKDTKQREEKKKEEASKDLNNTLAIITDATHKVETYVFHMFRYYTYSRMKKSADYYLLLSNSDYISWMSLGLSLLILTSGYLQLLFLKRLFNTNGTDQEEKPRC